MLKDKDKLKNRIFSPQPYSIYDYFNSSSTKCIHVLTCESMANLPYPGSGKIMYILW